jgi:hypothetical protein
MNIVDILGVGLREDCYTNLIYHAVLHITEFRENLLKALLGDTCKQDTEDWRFYTRNTVSLEDHHRDIPDLLFVSQTQNKVIVIENKVLAKEGERQTERYASDTFRRAIESHYQLVNADFYYYYLTLEGKPAKSPLFKSITYGEIVSLLPRELHADTNLSLLLEEFRERVREYENWPDPKEEMIALEYLNNTRGFVTQYRNFCRLVDLLGLEEFVVRKDVTSNRGSGFIPVAKFSLPHWIGEEYTEQVDGLSCYDIHIELQWNTNKNHESLSLQLHYQTHPYLTNQKFKQCSQWFQSSFDLGKSALLHKLREREHRLTGFRIRNNFLSLASYTFNSEITIGQLRRQIRRFTSDLAEIIECALHAPIKYSILPQPKEGFYQNIRFVTRTCYIYGKAFASGGDPNDTIVVVSLGADDPSDLDTTASNEFALMEAQDLLTAYGGKADPNTMVASEIHIHGQSELATREYRFVIRGER